MSESGEETRDRQEEGRTRVKRNEGAAESRKQIYLRTVYPLNPGIPHFVDVPGGW